MQIFGRFFCKKGFFLPILCLSVVPEPKKPPELSDFQLPFVPLSFVPLYMVCPFLCKKYLQVLIIA